MLVRLAMLFFVVYETLDHVESNSYYLACLSVCPFAPPQQGNDLWVRHASVGADMAEVPARFSEFRHGRFRMGLPPSAAFPSADAAAHELHKEPLCIISGAWPTAVCTVAEHLPTEGVG